MVPLTHRTATRAGRPLYESFGFEAIEPLTDDSTGTPIPLLRMSKAITGYPVP